MTEPETRDYLFHHLKLAGRSDQLFSDDAAALIHQTGGGLPRAVNNLGLQALVATYAANKTIVDALRRPRRRRRGHRRITPHDHDDTVNSKSSTRPTKAPPHTPGGAFNRLGHPHPP